MYLKIIISTLLLVLLAGITSSQIENEKELPQETSFLPTSNEYGEITYINDLNDVRTEIKETGDVELSKWNKEVFMKIEKPNIYPALSLTNAETSDNKLISKTSDKVDLEWYFKEISESVEGLEYEIILKEKPSTNVISFPIDSENLNFYYQPPLYLKYGLIEPNATCNATDCQGSYRPIDVVGSYAVYHSSKMNNEYMTGKAFHIYRPLIIDANEDTIWGELNIENSVMTISVNQDWLDKAVYPVVIDPSFGHNTVGGSSGDIGFDAITGSIFQITESGTAGSISFYATFWSSGKAYCALYDEAEDFVNMTVEDTDVDSGAWNTLDFSDGPSLTSDNKYWIVVGSGSPSPNIFNWDDGTTNQGVATGDNGWTYGSWPSTLPGTKNNNKYSIYANYTVAPTDTCSCPVSGDWGIDASDNCVISDDCDMQTNTVACYGTGTIDLNAAITNFDNVFIHTDCDLFCRKTPSCFE